MSLDDARYSELLYLIALARAAAVSAGAEASVLVFQPGGASAGNQFTDWNALYAAFLQTRGPVQIAIDVTFAPFGIASLPLGTYDMQGRATLTTSGLNAGGGAQLAIPAGGVLKNLVRMTGAIQINTSNAAGHPLIWDSPQATLDVSDGAAFLHTGAGKVMRVAAGQTLFVTIEGFIELNNAGPFGAFIDLIDATSTLALLVFDGVFFVTGNIVAGVAGSTVSYLYDATWPGDPANPGFLGAYNPPLRIDIAASMVYSPNPAKWAGAPPTNPQAAIDRMASLLVTLNGGVIP